MTSATHGLDELIVQRQIVDEYLDSLQRAAHQAETLRDTIEAAIRGYEGIAEQARMMVEVQAAFDRYQGVARQIEEEVGRRHHAAEIVRGTAAIAAQTSLHAVGVASPATPTPKTLGRKQRGVAEAIIAFLSWRDEPASDHEVLEHLQEVGRAPRSRNPLNALRATLSRMALDNVIFREGARGAARYWIPEAEDSTGDSEEAPSHE